MKLIIAFLALSFLAINGMAHIALTDDDVENPTWWPHYPPFPHPPSHSPNSDQAQKKCMKAVHNPDMVACMHDLQQYWKTHKINVSPDCCSALIKVGKACPLIKARHPYIGKIVKYHCQATPSPSPK